MRILNPKLNIVNKYLSTGDEKQLLGTPNECEEVEVVEAFLTCFSVFSFTFQMILIQKKLILCQPLPLSGALHTSSSRTLIHNKQIIINHPPPPDSNKLAVSTFQDWI